MKLKEIIKIIDGTVLTPELDLDVTIEGGCGADLMSDVLVSIQPNAILLTGLCNPQVVRTAEMADIKAIVLVRGKEPANETVELALEKLVPLVSSPYGMFELCGRLYQAGMRSLERTVSTQENCE